MLTISASQMGMFRETRVQAYIRQMVDYIAAEYPRHFARLGATGTRAFVQQSITQAEAIGIEIQGSIAVLTELWLVYGEQLERAPDREWARNILAHKTLPDYIKVGAVQERISERTGGRDLIVHTETP